MRNLVFNLTKHECVLFDFDYPTSKVVWRAEGGKNAKNNKNRVRSLLYRRLLC